MVPVAGVEGGYMTTLNIRARGQWNHVDFDAQVQDLTLESVKKAIRDNRSRFWTMQYEEIGANVSVFIKGTLCCVATGFIAFFGLSGLYRIDVDMRKAA